MVQLRQNAPHHFFLVELIWLYFPVTSLIAD